MTVLDGFAFVAIHANLLDRYNVARKVGLSFFAPLSLSQRSITNPIVYAQTYILTRKRRHEEYKKRAKAKASAAMIGLTPFSI